MSEVERYSPEISMDSISGEEFGDMIDTPEGDFVAYADYRQLRIGAWWMQIALSVQAAWVDVNERLPEEDGQYVAYADEHGACLAWFLCGRFDLSDKYMTHWMPIPERADSNE